MPDDPQPFVMRVPSQVPMSLLLNDVQHFVSFIDERYACTDAGALAGKTVIACPAGSLVPVGVIAAYGSKQAKLAAVRNPSPNGLVRVKPQVIGGVRSHGILVPIDDPRVAPVVAAIPRGDRWTASEVLAAAFAPKPAAQSKTLTTAQVVSVAVILLALIDAFAAAVEGIVKVLGDESEPCAK